MSLMSVLRRRPGLHQSRGLPAAKLWHLLDVGTGTTGRQGWTLRKAVVTDDFRGGRRTDGVVVLFQPAMGGVNYGADCDCFAIEVKAGRVCRFKTKGAASRGARICTGRATGTATSSAAPGEAATTASRAW